MQTQNQNTDGNENTNANPISTETTTINPIAKRLARLPHIITLPAETPEPRELKRLIEARIAELNSEQLKLNLRDEDQAFEFGANKCVLAILKQHLTELRQQFPEIDTPPAETEIPAITPIPPIPPMPALPTQFTEKNNSELTEPGEPAIRPQQHPTEPEVSRTEPEVSETEPGSLGSEPAEPNPSTNSDRDQQFAEALKKVPEGYQQIAADFYESIHRRSKFAKLTSRQRHAIYELNKTWNTESVLEIIAMPEPIGLGLRTSLAGLKRFLQDYRRILHEQQDLEEKCETEEARLAAEQSFQRANTSDESFRQAAERQIRKRLFDAANNPKSDYHEIRWLLKSLELLRKPQQSANFAST
ncbi:MAG TPA: hypothetical protein VI282_18110 [Verrucomicrobiae bacterium]